jgi:hypothetical protein
MLAETDLDVLFDPRQKEKLEILLAKACFKKFTAPAVRRYDQIEDYLGYDPTSGKVVHLHAHFMLTMGEIYLKSYQLGMEEKILQSRIYDEEFGIYRIHPAFELTLLFFRQALKIRNRDKIRFYLKRDIGIPPNMITEYEWLKERCNASEISCSLSSVLPEDHQRFYDLITGKFDGATLIKLAALLKATYKLRRLHSPMGALMMRWYRELYIKSFRWYARGFNQPVVIQRINPRGGLTVAVIGADGSGKSTVVNDLFNTFKKKLDVQKIYFGNGAGKKSWYRKLLVNVKKNVVDHQKPIKIKKQDPGFYKCLESL